MVTPRDSFPSQHHSTIDACLKTLRNVGKQLGALSSSFQEDTRLLERLYYKSKNQHKSALFWRKAVEVRRVSTKLVALDILSLIEGLRASFLPPSDGSKSQNRAAWTQVPATSCIVSTLHRLYEASLLLNKARSVFISAYQAFELLVRSSTFLPLAMSLIAITSRMDLLVFEMGNSLTDAWPVILKTTELLECNYRGPRKLAFPDSAAPDVLPQSPASQPLTIPGPTVTQGEDLGQSISRDEILRGRAEHSILVVSQPPSTPAPTPTSMVLNAIPRSEPLKARPDEFPKPNSTQSRNVVDVSDAFDGKEIKKGGTSGAIETSIPNVVASSSVRGINDLSPPPETPPIVQPPSAPAGHPLQLPLSLPPPSLLPSTPTLPKPKKKLKPKPKPTTDGPDASTRAEPGDPSRKVKKRKRKDEIDDIFGGV